MIIYFEMEVDRKSDFSVCSWSYRHVSLLDMRESCQISLFGLNHLVLRRKVFNFSQSLVIRVRELHTQHRYVNTSAVVDTTFVHIYVDTEDIPTCQYNIQHIDKRTMEK